MSRNLVYILLIFLAACQMKPTKVLNEEKLNPAVLKGAEVLKLNPVILDVRPAFDFNLAHAPGAINVRWEDFSQTSPQSRGVPLADRVSVARRLALIGIDLETPVVVLGRGAESVGEEGRVAWMLKLLGVQDVYTLHANLIKDRSLVRDTPQVKNKPYWTPLEKPFQDYMVSQPQFKAILKNSDMVILDVRSTAEISLQSLATSKNLKAAFKSLEWKNFFDKNGAPTEEVLAKLSAQGLDNQKQIAVISNHGVRSAAVTYALHQLGWKNVKNYAGGYEQHGYK